MKRLKCVQGPQQTPYPGLHNQRCTAAHSWQMLARTLRGEAGHAGSAASISCYHPKGAASRGKMRAQGSGHYLHRTEGLLGACRVGAHDEVRQPAPRCQLLSHLHQRNEGGSAGRPSRGGQARSQRKHLLSVPPGGVWAPPPRVHTVVRALRLSRHDGSYAQAM